ncbi:MAG: hypothetical protein NZ853_10160 [Leptospiraceae bacterium]|nr:hypothetical protein [Leptospiraceae bacterium]MDW7974980.1 hypothetical protein [Leptospiraceae bacterium]
MIGDIRRKKHVIPLGFKFIDIYLKAGFRLRELIIKQQHNCRATGFWYKNSIKHNFLLLAHEYLLIFENELPLSVKLDHLEATTVWILPEKISKNT